jgi:hypothetical protein
MAERKRILTDEERRAKNAENARKWRATHPDYYKQSKYKAYNKAWRMAHRDRSVKASRKWQQKNYEAYRAYNDAWRKANPDKVKQYDRNKRQRRRERDLEAVRTYAREKQRKYRAADPEHFREVARRRYHAQLHKSRFRNIQKARRYRNLTGFHSIDQWLDRVAYYGWRCKWCGKELTDLTLTKDHIVPVSKGGTDWPANLAPACQPCNSGKCARRTYSPRQS